MKRDPRLQPLSSDHHHALVLARHAERAAQADAAADAAWHTVRSRFHAELAPHFEIEERILLPALDAAGHTSLADRTRADHAAIRACVSDEAPADTRAALARFAELVTTHIRFEERVLFEAAQDSLPDAALDAVLRASGSATRGARDTRR